MGTRKERSLCTLDLCSLPCCRRRVENKTDATFCKGAPKSVGIQPDVLVLRAEHPLSDGLRKKVAQFCNVDDKAVVQSIDAETIYEVPILDAGARTGQHYPRKDGTTGRRNPGLGPWRKFLERRHAAETKEPINIALVGKIRFAGCL